MEQFTRDSFAATIAFGLLAMALLVFAAIAFGSDAALTYGLLACAAAYVAQWLTTYNMQCVVNTGSPNVLVASMAIAFNLFAAGFWIVGLCVLT